ncbi:response regulator transcription factor [Steroidobacter sp. S1-65]|uniref:Response regulator transcription factor n=1 Tax=Steroidobacter gossypii TaxID=2805490 RepID=A0ABS1WZN6_9GAMM|nr:response regulator transcription factor [Steroidobacter gossypii]MBM0106428.1 response regulator transcription factor [Steroidobacter gossypii]
MRLLLVEDNPQLAGLVLDGLARQGFAIDRAGSLKEAIAARAAASYDLILLDLGLPDGDGMSLVRQLREGNDSTPILILTARGGLNDRLIGLDSGADDYLVKPFEIAELAARCRALLRRPGASLGVVLQLGNVALDTTTRMVTVNEQRIEVPPREVTLLELLLRRAEQVVRRSHLEESLYSFGDEVTPNALESAVSRLRKRLAAAQATVLVRTAHGIGYAIFQQS